MIHTELSDPERFEVSTIPDEYFFFSILDTEGQDVTIWFPSTEHFDVFCAALNDLRPKLKLDKETGQLKAVSVIPRPEIEIEL